MLALGVFALAVFLLASSVVAILIGPENFLGYVLYTLGWLMVGHGVTLFGSFKLNASYAYAIFPIATYIHRFFWKIYLTIIYYKGLPPQLINNFFSRMLTFIPVMAACVLAWYALGSSIMYVAAHNATINEDLFRGFGAIFHDNPIVFQIPFTIMILITYALVFWKWRVAMSHEDFVEGLTK